MGIKIEDTTLRKANEYAGDVERFSTPGSLFDEFWRVDELALFFGEPGAGKSVLAVQIADALAGGRPIEGFLMSTRRWKVLYVDLVLRDAQFQERYSYRAENAPYSKSYKFAERLYRGRPPKSDDLCEWLRETVAANGFEIVIIDDLSAVKKTHDGTRETLRIMRRLKEIRNELNISIMVLADSERAGRDEPVSERDLRRSRILCTVADSVFAIGPGRHKADERRLVQTRAFGAPIYWDEGNPAVGRVERLTNGMLGLRFEELSAVWMDDDKRDLVCRIKTMRDSGTTYRGIAAELGISKSRALRLRKKWTRALENLNEYQDECDDDLYDADRYDDAGDPDNDFARSEPDGPYDDIDQADEPDAWELPPDARRPSMPGLTRVLDADRGEIFVESEDEHTGKPSVWYQFDNQGGKLRFKRCPNGIFTERLNSS